MPRKALLAVVPAEKPYAPACQECGDVGMVFRDSPPAEHLAVKELPGLMVAGLVRLCKCGWGQYVLSRLYEAKFTPPPEGVPPNLKHGLRHLKAAEDWVLSKSSAVGNVMRKAGL